MRSLLFKLLICSNIAVLAAWFFYEQIWLEYKTNQAIDQANAKLQSETRLFCDLLNGL